MLPRRFPGNRLPLGGVCAVLVGVFYLATIRDGQDWPDDFSQYIQHALNIAEGAPYAATGYIYNPHNPGIGPRTYPPGFPLLLAPVIKGFGLKLRPMRVLGIVLVPCFIGHDLIRTRRIGRQTVLAGGAFVALAGAQYLLWIRDSSYLDPFTGGVAGIGHNIVAYLRSLSELWENGFSDALRKAAFLAASALAAVGYVRSLRRHVAVVHLFPWLYLGPVIAWPSFQDTRFLIPIIPFYFYFGLFGIREMDAAVERRWGRKHLALATLLAGVAVSYAGRYATLPFGPLAEGIAKPESVRLFEFVKDSTAPTDVLVFSRPRALALFTGRRVSGGYRPGDPCELWRYLSEIGAAYLVTGPEPDVWNAEAGYLRQFLSRFEDDFL